MHIKFFKHGKGSASKASSYLLDQRDHKGEMRAEVSVLRGDAYTFNAICDASPHLWKYTSGVIAWSKEDAPTDKQIKEVLDEFEEHAFAGLDKNQYHLLAVQHTDEDGSKHVHIVVPRMELDSGKSLNIAPPNHEKHFDPLRDYFNSKYNWSRPDDVLLSKTTQEPNHIIKLNAQVKNILKNEDFGNLIKSQFCKVIDSYIRTGLETGEIKNRADIVQSLQELNGISSIKQSKNFLTVTLTDNTKHRLKGDFYYEQFEIGSYSKHIRENAENRGTQGFSEQSISIARQHKDEARAKREAYNNKQFRTNNNIRTNRQDEEYRKGIRNSKILNNDRNIPQQNSRFKHVTGEYQYIKDCRNQRANEIIFKQHGHPNKQSERSNIEFPLRSAKDRKTFYERIRNSTKPTQFNNIIFRSRGEHIKPKTPLLWSIRNNNNGTISESFYVTKTSNNLNNEKDAKNENRNRELLEARTRLAKARDQLAETRNQLTDNKQQTTRRSEQTTRRSEQTVNQYNNGTNSKFRELCSDNKLLSGRFEESRTKNIFDIYYSTYSKGIRGTCASFTNRVKETSEPTSYPSINDREYLRQYKLFFGTSCEGIEGFDIQSIDNRNSEIQRTFNDRNRERTESIENITNRIANNYKELDPIAERIKTIGIHVDFMPFFNKINQRFKGIPYFDEKIELLKEINQLFEVDTSDKDKLRNQIDEKHQKYILGVYGLDAIVNYGQNYGIFLNKTDLEDIKTICKIFKMDIQQIEKIDFPKYIDKLKETDIYSIKYSEKSLKEEYDILRKNMTDYSLNRIESFLNVVNEKIQTYDSISSADREHMQQEHLKENQLERIRNNKEYDSPSPF